jgi:hypothetical protein
MGVALMFGSFMIGLAGFSAGTADAVEAGDKPTGAGVEMQPKSGAKNSSRRVCRNLVVSGSRLSTRSCRAQADWEKDAEQARNFLEKGQLNGAARDASSQGTTPR